MNESVERRNCCQHDVHVGGQLGGYQALEAVHEIRPGILLVQLGIPVHPSHVPQCMQNSGRQLSMTRNMKGLLKAEDPNSPSWHAYPAGSVVPNVCRSVLERLKLADQRLDFRCVGIRPQDTLEGGVHIVRFPSWSDGLLHILTARRAIRVQGSNITSRDQSSVSRVVPPDATLRKRGSQITLAGVVPDLNVHRSCQDWIARGPHPSPTSSLEAGMRSPSPATRQVMALAT